VFELSTGPPQSPTENIDEDMGQNYACGWWWWWIVVLSCRRKTKK